jgi:hypothetical protein
MRSLLFLVMVGCGTSSPAAVVDSSVEDVAAEATPDVLPDVGGDGSKAAACASTFGDALTASFGRIDGFVTAVVGPPDMQCPLPNNDHVIVQVRMAGKIYRMVVNVQSDRGADLRVRFGTIDHALLAPAWAEGWHTGIPLDYPSMLDAHVAAFMPYEMTPLVAKITDALTIGAPVSVYASSSGGASAHKIHRNTAGTNSDGAIVVDPQGAKPKWLLFHFADQTF